MFDELFQLIRTHYGSSDFIPLHEPRFSDLDKQFVVDAIDSTYVSSVGEYVDRFEEELAAYVGAKRAVAVVNGTSALQVALQLAGVQAGDEVITQALTFVATANAVSYNGASPVFIDVDRDTMGLSPEALSRFLNEYAEPREHGVYNRKSGKRIAAILPMHTFGHSCRIEEICAIAEEWGIPVVEDAAEALGSTYRERYCGTFGILGVYSFNGNKTITCGGGGAIVTDNEALADRVKHLTTTAKVPHRWEFVHDEVGFNYRMPNLNAALACAQLRKIDELLADKRAWATECRDFFTDKPWAEFVDSPPNCESNFWLNSIAFSQRSERDVFLEAACKADVMVRPVWQPMHQLKMYSTCQRDELAETEWLSERVVNLPSSARKYA